MNAAPMFEICFRMAYDDLGFHGTAARRVTVEVRRRKLSATKPDKPRKPAAKAAGGEQ